MKHRIHRANLATLLLTASILAPAPRIVAQSQSTVAPTKIVFHKNKYSPEDDVKIGRQAAAQAERQLPLLRDREVNDYLETLGQRLVAAIPEEFQHPEFRYYFRAVEDRQINAFALPGGPMYVNTGTILAARSEGELAGVMAHELSHVALRHGTAQATKAQKYSILALMAGVTGAVVGGPGLGQLAESPFGLYLLKYSREYETEADLLGARIMSRAGYDPRDLANMFRIIEAQGGGGGGFLSDHPSPKDRYARINQEAQSLKVTNPITANTEFHRIQEGLRGYRYSTSNQRGGNRYPSQGGNYPSTAPGGRVESPSSQYRSYSEFGVVRLSVPTNWQEQRDQSSVWFGPAAGSGSMNGNSVYTHGVSVGTYQARNRSLQQATDEFIRSLEQRSTDIRSRGGYQRTNLAGRNAESISLTNRNETTGRTEIIDVVTTQLRNGDLLYFISVAPENDYTTYQRVFQNILRSIEFND